MCRSVFATATGTPSSRKKCFARMRKSVRIASCRSTPRLCRVGFSLTSNYQRPIPEATFASHCGRRLRSFLPLSHHSQILIIVHPCDDVIDHLKVLRPFPLGIFAGLEGAVVVPLFANVAERIVRGVIDNSCASYECNFFGWIGNSGGSGAVEGGEQEAAG